MRVAATTRSAGCLRAKISVYPAAMSSPQDPPARKKQKNRATKKLLKWREKQEAQPASAPPAKK